MKTITHKSIEYTFIDELLIEQWLTLPEEEDPKMAQLNMIVAMSIEPKLTIPSLRKMGFKFLKMVMADVSPMGED